MRAFLCLLRYSMPRRLACLAALLTSLPGVAQLQPSPSWEADAARPEAPTAALVHKALPPTQAVQPAATPWRSAHETVAEFPRGHADIVAWEARHSTSAAPVAPTPPVAGHQHGHHHYPATPGRQP